MKTHEPSPPLSLSSLLPLKDQPLIKGHNETHYVYIHIYY